MNNHLEQTCDIINDLHIFILVTTDENADIPYNYKCICGMLRYGDYLKRENDRLRKKMDDGKEFTI